MITDRILALLHTCLHWPLGWVLAALFVGAVLVDVLWGEWEEQ